MDKYLPKNIQQNTSKSNKHMDVRDAKLPGKFQTELFVKLSLQMKKVKVIR